MARVARLMSPRPADRDEEGGADGRDAIEMAAAPWGCRSRGRGWRGERLEGDDDAESRGGDEVDQERHAAFPSRRRGAGH